MSDNPYDELYAPKPAPSRAQQIARQYPNIFHEQDSQAAQANVLDPPNPDVAARANQHQRDLGVPASLARDDIAQWDVAAAQKRMLLATTAWPNIAQYMAKPDQAAVSHDDLPSLASLSQRFFAFNHRQPTQMELRSLAAAPPAWATANYVTTPGPPWAPYRTPEEPGIIDRMRNMTLRDVGTAAHDTVVGVPRALKQSAPQLFSQIDGLLQGGADFLNNMQLYDRNGLRALTGDRSATTDYATMRDAAPTIANALDSVSGYLSAKRRYWNGISDALAPETDSRTARALLNGVTMAPQSAVALGAAAMGRPELGTAMLAGLTGGSSYGTARDAGLPVGDAYRFAVTDAAIEYATELGPEMRFATDAKVGTPFFKRMLHNMGTEQVGEQTATALQDLNQWAAIDANKGKTFGQYLAERPGAAYDTALAVAATVGISNTAHYMGEQLVKRADTVIRARENGAALDGVMEDAAGSKTRARDPESFRQFVQGTVEGSRSEHVYIPAEAVAKYMQSEGFKDHDGFFEGIAPQLAEAQATGGDVVAPLADVATKLAGTPAWEALRQDARIEAGGLSVREALKEGDAVREEIATRGEQIANQLVNQDEERAPTQAVFDDVKQRLLAIGRSENEATHIAAIYAASAEAFGQRFGVDAKTFHDQNPVSFETATDAGSVTAVAPPADAAPVPVSSVLPTVPGELIHFNTKDGLGVLRLRSDGHYDLSVGTPAKSGPLKGKKAFSGVVQRVEPERIKGLLDQIEAKTDAVTDGGASVLDQQLPPSLKPAVRHGGKVYSSVADHLSAISQIADPVQRQRAMADGENRGYVNEKGKFLNRFRAQEYAVANGLLREDAPAWAKTSPDLISENLRRFYQPALTSLPLTDLPASSPGPFQVAREAAERYMAAAGLPYSPTLTFAKVDVARAKRIAAAYDRMKHDPTNPEVKASYDALVKETLAQWNQIKLTGLQVEFVDGADPYAGNPGGAVHDVRENNHLWVFNTEDGYGTDGLTDVAENPMLAIVPGETWSGKLVRVNDVFRAVHDYFGHIKEGVGFRARGEENAWLNHATMYSPLARGAMTTETRGQNSWLNFGPHGETNQTANVEDTVFADQKIGLMPSWTWEQGAPEQNRADASAANKAMSKTKVVAADGKPMVVYHGTPYVFDQFKDRPRPDWFAESAALAATYTDPRRRRMAGGAPNIRPVYLDIRNPLDLGDPPTGVKPQDYAASLGLGEVFDNNDTDLTYSVYNDARFIAAAMAAGYDGIRVVENGTSVTWAPFHRSQIASIFDRPGEPRNYFQSDINPFPGTEKQRNPPALFQNNEGPRGQIALYPEHSVITLFENANLSTLIHETGHHFFNVLQRSAQRADAPQGVRDDWAKVEKWLTEQGTPVVDGKIPREGHELLARGFERYAMEGKAPSSALQAAFAAFKGWLLRIYEVVQNLRSPINPELRDVMDRMLATQTAIDEYAKQQNIKGAFTDAAQAGMTEAQWQAYQQSIVTAKDDAYDALLFKTMHRIAQQRKLVFAEKSKAIRQAVTAEVNDEPRFKAIRLMRTGKIGDTAVDGAKLNRDWASENYGPDIEDRLPAGLLANDGMHGDEMAELTGHPSGDALIKSLMDVHDQQTASRAAGDKRQLRDRLIDERVKAAIDKEGLIDPLTDGSIEQEAIEALNNDKMGDVLATELRHLARRTKAQPTPYRLARDWAKTKIEAGLVKDTISRSALQRYSRAAAKASREAESAIISGDTDEAFRQKQAQMLNHALYVEAKAAADQVDTIVARMNKLSKRAAMKSIDQDYFDRVHEMLEAFDFRPRSQKALDERESFAEWAAKRAAQGFEVHIPPRLLDSAQHYTRVDVQTLYGLADTIESMMALGRLKQKIIDGKAEREFGAMLDEMIGKVSELPDRSGSRLLGKLPYGPNINEALGALPNAETEKRNAIRGFNSELIKIETLAQVLDGHDPNGPFTRLLAQRASDVENRRHALRTRTLDPIAKAYLSMPKKERVRLEEKVTIPELLHRGSELDPRNGQPITLTRMELLSIALNTGNKSNFDKLVRGEKWSGQAIRTVLDRELTANDWKFVQGIWDGINSLWPDIAAVERRLSGVVPERVEATPIQTRHGIFPGGYYPVVYDSSRSQIAENYEANANNDLFGSMSGVSTSKGHTITRTDAAGPLSRSVEQVIFNHVERVVTRIAYAEYARDVLRVIEQPRIRDAINLKLGPEYRAQIKPWLRRVVNDGRPDPNRAKFAEGFFRGVRSNMTVGVMGFKASVGIAQLQGLTASAGIIGPRAVARGIGDIMLDLARGRTSFVQFIESRSPEMARRAKEVNREVAEMTARVSGQTGLVRTAQRMALWHIAFIDRYMVAMPTWLGAHRKGIADGMTDEQASHYADSAVRQSQGSGSEKDLSSVQSRTHGEAFKWLTLFYTYFNVQHNAGFAAIHAAKRGQFQRAIMLTGAFFILAPLADALVSGDWPDDDADPTSWFGWATRNMFFNLFSGVPGVRDAGNFAERKITGQYATASFSPLDRMVDVGGRAGQDAFDIYSGGKEFDSNSLRTDASAAGYAFGLPGDQVGATTKFLWDYNNGEAAPQNVSDWYYGLTKGSVPKDKDK